MSETGWDISGRSAPSLRASGPDSTWISRILHQFLYFKTPAELCRLMRHARQGCLADVCANREVSERGGISKEGSDWRMPLCRPRHLAPLGFPGFLTAISAFPCINYAASWGVGRSLSYFVALLDTPSLIGFSYRPICLVRFTDTLQAHEHGFGESVCSYTHLHIPFARASVCMCEPHMFLHDMQPQVFPAQQRCCASGAHVRIRSSAGLLPHVCSG